MGVWIETYYTMRNLIMFQSHPSWVCGLKQAAYLGAILYQQSHPSWVCGLKLLVAVLLLVLQRHTLRGCVD